MTPFGNVLSWSSSASGASGASAASALHHHAQQHATIPRKMMPMHRMLLHERTRRMEQAALVAGLDDVTSSAATMASGGSKGSASASSSSLVAPKPIGGRNSTSSRPSAVVSPGAPVHGGGNATTSTAAAAENATAKVVKQTTQDEPPPPSGEGGDDQIWPSSDDDDETNVLAGHDYPHYANRPPPPLESPWWVRLTESDGTDPNDVPPTRRAHSSCVYTVSADIVHVDKESTATTGITVEEGKDDGDGSSSSSSSGTAENDEGASTTQRPKDDPDPAAPAAPSSHTPGQRQRRTAPAETTPTFATTTANNRRSDRSVFGDATYQEYMITSGGFTDDDWYTFPVWAYETTTAALDGAGTWTDLTPPTPEPTILAQCAASTVRPDARSDVDDAWAYAMDCPPPPRVGHLTITHKGYLYVFGGLLYNDRDGVFYEEEQPFVYRLRLEDKLGIAARFRTSTRESNSNNATMTATAAAAAEAGWQRIVPKVSVPPTDDINVNVGGSSSTSSGNGSPHGGPNRGEVRGGLWTAADKVVIYGGLRVQDVPSVGVGFGTTGTRERQVDTPLGDVWSYDLTTDAWEMMAPAGWGGGVSGASDFPPDRTAHAAAVSGNDLVIFGGMEKVGESPWDGSTEWTTLSDVWVFDLEERVWRDRVVFPSLSRAYHSMVAWDVDYGDGPVLAAFGGYTTVDDPVSEEPITFVFDDTIVSNPPTNGTYASAWLKASWPSEAAESISNRLEHTAVLSDTTGEMFVWGGRFENTRQIEGVWALNVAGSTSAVGYDLAEPDGLDDYEESLAAMHVLLAALMFMSLIFTTMCGVFNRHHDDDDAEGGGENGGPSGGRRGGLRQSIIDTLPLKTYHAKEEDGSRDMEAGQQVAGSSLTSDNRGSESAEPEQVPEGLDGHDGTNDAPEEFATEDSLANEDDCCPICLVEYNEGDEIRCLPCHHEFHKSCVDPWLGNNASCPACRHCLRGLPTPPAPGLLSNISTSSLSFPRTSLTWSNLFNPTRHNPRGREVGSEATNDEPPSSVDDLALHYVSSLELEEESAAAYDREDPEVIGDRQSRSSSPDNSSRHSRRRGRGRTRRRGTRMGSRLVPLNDPLQADASAVLV